jgi:hypothetical protein
MDTCSRTLKVGALSDAGVVAEKFSVRLLNKNLLGCSAALKFLVPPRSCEPVSA